VKARTFALLVCIAGGTALPALAQDGLRLPARSEPGLDPSYAAGWLSPERDRAGFARYQYHWRDAFGFAPTQRMQWSYALGNTSFGLSVANGRDFDNAPVYGTEMRQYGLFGRYSLAQDWSLVGEGTVSRDPTNSLLRQEFRFGLRRQF
jgi:hypothetical protein